MKYKGTTAAAHAQSTHAQGINKNISFKNIRVGHGCLLSPTHSNSEDKVRVFYAIKFKCTKSTIHGKIFTKIFIQNISQNLITSLFGQALPT